MQKIKIIINGSSSFTGFHFIKRISKIKNYELICLISKGKKNKDQTLRINELKKIKNLKIIYEINYLSQEYFKILNKYNNYILILHYAYNLNYKKDESFDMNNFLKKNIFNIEKLYETIRNRCRKIIISNSYFQKDQKNTAHSKYGLSKDISFLFHEYYSKKYNIEYKINMISNPFGEYEEKRLLYYTINCWNKGLIPTLSNPHDMNDFILIDDLAKEFAKFIGNKDKILSLSQYYETNFSFVIRLKKIYEKLLNKKVNINKTKKLQNFSRKNKISIKKNKKGLENYVKYAINNY